MREKVKVKATKPSKIESFLNLKAARHQDADVSFKSQRVCAKLKIHQNPQAFKILATFRFED